MAATWGQKRKEVTSFTATITMKHVGRIFDLDPDTLDCPICTLPFSPPVYQTECQNGHIACSVCCKKITKGCPSCSQPFGHIRNRAIENVVEHLQADCTHAHLGCNKKLKYSEREEIEDREKKLCEYGPIQCIYGNCKHIGPKFAWDSHLAKENHLEIVECPGSMRRARFKMKAPIRCVIIRAEKAQLLVRHWTNSTGSHRFYCSTLEILAYKLTVKPVQLNNEPNVVYSMQSEAQEEHQVKNLDSNSFGDGIDDSDPEFEMTLKLL